MALDLWHFDDTLRGASQPELERLIEFYAELMNSTTDATERQLHYQLKRMCEMALWERNRCIKYCAHCRRAGDSDDMWQVDGDTQICVSCYNNPAYWQTRKYKPVHVIEVGDYVVIKVNANRWRTNYDLGSHDAFCKLRDIQSVGIVESICEGLIRVNFATHFAYFIPQRDELQLVDIDAPRGLSL